MTNPRCANGGPLWNLRETRSGFPGRVQRIREVRLFPGSTNLFLSAPTSSHVRMMLSANTATTTVFISPTVSGWFTFASGLRQMASVTTHRALRELSKAAAQSPRPDVMRHLRRGVNMIDLERIPRAAVDTGAVFSQPVRAPVAPPHPLVCPHIFTAVSHRRSFYSEVLVCR